MVGDASVIVVARIVAVQIVLIGVAAVDRGSFGHLITVAALHHDGATRHAARVPVAMVNGDVRVKAVAEETQDVLVQRVHRLRALNVEDGQMHHELPRVRVEAQIASPTSL